MRRNSGASLIWATILTCASWAEEAWPESDIFGALDIERRHAVYLPSSSTVAQGIVVNQWTRPVRLGPIYPLASRGSRKSQAASALQELDEQLAALGADRANVLELTVFVQGAGAESHAVLDLISAYLHERRSSRVRSAEVHSRALLAVFEVRDLNRVGDLGSDVVLFPTILDPQTATSDQRSDLAWAYQPRADRPFLIGAHAGDPLNASVAYEGDGRTALSLALGDVRRLLTDIAARPDDVDEATVYFDPGMVSEADLRPVLDEFLPNGAPRVDYIRPRVKFVAARVVSAATSSPVALRVSGRVTHYR